MVKFLSIALVLSGCASLTSGDDAPTPPLTICIDCNDHGPLDGGTFEHPPDATDAPDAGTCEPDDGCKTSEDCGKNHVCKEDKCYKQCACDDDCSGPGNMSCDHGLCKGHA